MARPMPVAYGARIGLCAIGAYGLLPSTMRPIGRIRGRFSYIMSATASAPAGCNVPASPAATRVPGRRVAPCMSRVSAQARHIEPAFPQDVCSGEGNGLTRADGRRFDDICEMSIMIDRILGFCRL